MLSIKLSAYRKIIIGFGIGFLGFIVARKLLQQKSPSLYVLDTSSSFDQEGSEKKSPPLTNQAKSNTTDNLEEIYGIGPKIKSILLKNGITSFSKLQMTDRNTLQKILQDGGIRFAQIDTWQEQAQLAADQRWEDLKNLQRFLKQKKA